MVNYFIGRISTTYLKEFEDTFNPGNKNLFFQVAIPQKTAVGQGGKGSDYTYCFFNVRISSKNLYGKRLIDGKALIIGELRQAEGKMENDKKGQPRTYIKATRIYSLSELPEEGTETIHLDKLEEDSSILWED